MNFGEREFAIVWDCDTYQDCDSKVINNFYTEEFFSDEKGFDDEDIKQIDALEPMQNVVLSMGDVTIVRLK